MIPLIVAASLYGVATLLYLRYLLRDSVGAQRTASLVLQGAFLVHTVVLGLWIGEVGPDQLHRLHAVMPVVAWLVVAAYLIVEARFSLAVLGTLVVPLVTITLVVSLASLPGRTPLPDTVRGLMLTLHVLGATLGLGAFFLSCCLSAFYLLQLRQLKRKRFGSIYRRLPSLDTMDRLAFRFVTAGFPAYTVAVVLGAFQAYQDGGFGQMGRAYLFALASWVLYGLVLQGRLTTGWRGRRAALLVLGGFFASSLILVHFLVS